MITDIDIAKLDNGMYELQYDPGTGDLYWEIFETLDELLEYLKSMVEKSYEL